MTQPKSKAPQRKNNTTGYRGVTTLPNGKFVGQFYDGKTKKTLRGQPRTKAIDAAKDYDTIASQHLGDKARLNFPKKIK